LPSEWRTHTLIWRNKTYLEEQSLDDLFNSLKIYEAEVKSSSAASTSTQNIAFVPSFNTDNTNEQVSAAASFFASFQEDEEPTNYALMAFSSSSSSSNNESLQAINLTLVQVSKNNLIKKKQGRKFVQEYMIFPIWSSGSTNPHNTDGDATFYEKEPEFEGRKPKSEVNVSLSSSAQSKKHDDKTKKKAKGKRYRNLSAEFEDFSDNSINEDNVAATLVPAVGKLSPNSTNTFSAASPSNFVASPTHGKSSCIDTSQLLDDPNMPELKDITYSDNKDDVDAEADFNKLETSITVSHITTTRVYKDHPVTRIIGDLSLATQIRSKFDGKVDEGVLVGYFNTDGDAAFDEKEPEFKGTKPESEVCVSPSRYKNLSVEFKDLSDNNINEDNAASTLVLAVRQISPNSTNTFSDAGPSNTAANITYFDDEDDVGVEADFNNLETSITHPRSLGKFDGKADEGFFVGYSVSSKAFRVFNSRTRIVQETLHINFLENQPNATGSGPTWLFDIDTLTKSMNYQPVVAGNQPNSSVGIQEHFDAGKAEEGNIQQYVLFPLWSTGCKDPHNIDADDTFEVKEPESKVHVSPSSSAKTKKHDDKTKREAKGTSHVELSTEVRNLSEDFSSNSTNGVNAASTPVTTVEPNSTNSTKTFIAAGPSNNPICSAFKFGGKSSFVDPSQYPNDPSMPALEDFTYSADEEDVGAEADFSNLETSITISPIPTSRIYKDHHVTQIIGDLSSAPQTRSMTRTVKDQGGLTQIYDEDFHTCMFVCFLSQEETKRVHQALKDPSWIEAMQEELFQFKMQKVWVLVDLPKGFEDPDYHDKVYKVVKALHGLHQAPRACSIKYALTVNPNIYVSCIKQFWTSVAVKKVNDVTRLQALVDKKKVIIMEATIIDALCLDDAEGIECLPSDETFIELTRMGYEKPSTKLTFYKAFFSSQWKFLIHTILQCMSAKRTSWNEFSSSLASATICLSTCRKFNFSKVGKGFFRVETPLFEGMIVEQPVGKGADKVHDEGVPADGVAVEGDVSAADDVVPTAIEEPSIPSPTPPTPPPQPSQHQPSTSQVYLTPPQLPQAQPQASQDAGISIDLLQTYWTHGRMIADMDADVDVTLKDVASDAKDGQAAEIEEKLAEPQEVVEVITTAKLITKVVTAASTTITVAALQITTTAALTLTTAPSAARRRKGVVIRDLEESATPSTIIHSEAKFKDKGKGILMDYFKGMTYDDIRLIFEKKFNSNVAFLQKTKEQMDEEDSRALKRLSESQDDKAAKK
nr:hypothetical protein [Tanacetum cinerariifolium]